MHLRGMGMEARARVAAEWLEADGLGGFAMGPVEGPRTRRYHALSLVATTPPTGRLVLVNGFEAHVETPRGRSAITEQCYVGGGRPEGVRRAAFEAAPWPTWRFDLGEGTELEQQIFVVHGRPETIVSWRRTRGHGPIRLVVRPFLSGRDQHALHRENAAFRFDPELRGEGEVVFHPYADVPAIAVRSTGRYRHAPEWYRAFQYAEEEARGLDHVEDLAAPGLFEFDLESGEGAMIFAAGSAQAVRSDEPVTAYVARARRGERARRARFFTRLERAADAYVVTRGAGKTVIAGYPWFTDWGRDTFIALRGLAFGTGRLELAREILLAWAELVSEGMLPNTFSDQGGVAKYNAVDASLWFVVVVYEYLERTRDRASPIARTLMRAADAILDGYTQGTRHRIRADADGLLAAGEPGVQLTWMDAKVGDLVVTPRIGKPVEVQALWLNALRAGASWSSARGALLERGLSAFPARFVRPDGRGLYDVVDVDHTPGAVDARLRPNQILAVGGLPFPVLTGSAARRVVDVVERELLTPLGLRTLAPSEAGYRPSYTGDVFSRDTAYHQGTVWPWLIGPFVDAWLFVRGRSKEARAEAERRFLRPLLAHLDGAGIGHVSEIADGAPPHTPRGCPFQAWSVGELIRAVRLTQGVV